MTEHGLITYPIPFPSVSFFDVLQQNKIKTLIIDDTIRFEKMTYRNRYYVCGAHGSHLLSIPVANGRNQRIPMRDVKIDNQTNWQTNHWKTLMTHYKRAPFFEHIAPFLEPLFLKKVDYLVDFNKESLTTVLRLLNWNIAIEEGAPLFPPSAGNIDIRREGKPLLPFLNMESRNYHQVFIDRCGFLPEMSVLDYLFNEGIHL